MKLLENKRALIVGLATDRSIACGIAQALHDQGAELALSYQNERLESSVRQLAKRWNVQHIFPCDLAYDDHISRLFSDLNHVWEDGFDILIHSVAFAPADQLQGDYVTHVNRQGFLIAHEVSSYTLGALTQAAAPYMEKRGGGSVVTLSYLGAERVLPNYNIMGLAKASLEANVRYLAASLGPKNIRVNAISAGPIRTLAASGIKGFKGLLNYHQKVTPLRQNTSIEQVGHTAAFLCSDWASGITAETLHVDGGFHAVAISDAMLEEKSSS